MKYFSVACIMLLALFFTLAHALEMPDGDYTVREADTLWDISDSHFQDPFLWPKLWDFNPDIENPDLIYPGDMIRIPTKEELLRGLPAERRAVTRPDRKKPEAGDLFRMPPLERHKYIVTRDQYISSGWIAPQFPSVGEIVYSPMGREIVGKGDTVYLKFNNGEMAGPKFFAIRSIKEVKHPVTKKRLGHQIRVTGIVEVVGMEDGKPMAKVTSSFEDLSIGDGLYPFQEMEPPLIPSVMRSPSVDGYVIETHNNSRISGEGDIIFLDRGISDGLQVGDVFFALSDPPVQRSIGKIQIISLQQDTAAAVVLSSNREIMIGSQWGQKK